MTALRASKNRRFKVVIAEDEPLNRDLLRRLLEADERFEVVAEAKDGEAAARLIQDKTIDAAFLDIRMPHLTGIDVARNHDGGTPLIIFVTAFDEFAVEAFDLQIFDYVMKPIDRSRFSRTLNRIHEALTGDSDMIDGGHDNLSHIRATVGDRIVLIPLLAVQWFEAASQYVKVHSTLGEHLISTESLNSLEAKTSDTSFIRIHRSALINIAAIDSLRSGKTGGREVRLSSGVDLPVARSRVAAVEAAIARNAAQEAQTTGRRRG